MQHEKCFFLRSTIQYFNSICACAEAYECPERQMFSNLLLQHTMLFDRLDTSPPGLIDLILSLTSIFLHSP
jgi:hypothetical protein